MDQHKMGQLIFELRKTRQMTQRELAAKLNITDKAVSKWERGLSCPDILLLPPLAQALGITVAELFAGVEQVDREEFLSVSVDNTLTYADTAANRRVESAQKICALLFSMLLFIGIGVCIICDLALSGGLTWSLIPISSMIFAWTVLFPILRFGKRGVCASLLVASVLILPFLFVLSRMIPGSELMMPIGIRVSVISAAFLWGVVALFRYSRRSSLGNWALSLLLLIPVYLLINISISKYVLQPVVDVWDAAAFFALAGVAMVLFAVDYIRKDRQV